MDIQKDVEEAIKKNLPLEVGEVLQKELKLGREAREEVVRLTEKAKTSKNSHDELYRTVENLSDDKNKLTVTVEKNADAVAEAEEIKREAKVVAANFEARAAEQKCDLMKELVEKVFGHPSVSIRTETQSYDLPHTVDNNGNPIPHTGFQDVTQTTTQGKG